MGVHFSAIRCTEIKDTRRETWSPTDGLTCKISVHIKWEDRYRLINDIALNGYKRAWPYTITHADMDKLRPIPTDVTIRPMRDSYYNDDCQGCDYLIGIADITYKTWLPTREYVEFKTQAIRLDPNIFEWENSEGSNDTKSIQGIEGLTQTVYRLILVKEFDLTTFSLPNNFFVPKDAQGQPASAGSVDASSGLVGTIHNKDYISSLIVENTNDPSNPFKTEFVKFPKNTLLLLDPVISPGPAYVITPSDPGTSSEAPTDLSWRRYYRYKFRWLYRPEGHNKFWRSNKDTDSSAGSAKYGGWERIVVKGTNGAIFDPNPGANHGALLRDYKATEVQQLAPSIFTPLHLLPPATGQSCNALKLSEITGV